MRFSLAVTAFACLGACNQSEDRENSSISTTAAALTFEGAEQPDAAKRLAHGERLTHILGCTGCHRPNLEGQLFNKDSPEMGKLYASNITLTIPALTDTQLEALLRGGTHPTRGDLWIMPSEIFQRLSPADMKALIAYLRTIKPSGQPTPPPVMTDKARAQIASGKMRPVAQWVAQYKTEVPPDLGEKHRWGHYLTSATCAECHGGDLKGIPDFEPGVSTPDLDIAGTYSDAELIRLLTTGEGKTRKDLGLMSLVGRAHFSYLTAGERKAIIAYVKARAAASPAAPASN